jgi:hypothetical protein
MYLFAGSSESVEAARASLKSLRDWNFDGLLICTFIVGLGLLMELPEIVHDMCEIYGRKSRELRYWLTPSIDRKEYPKRDWVKKWSAFGWILIVLGVMGEGWFEAQVSKYDSALSNMTDSIVAEAQKESAQAEAVAKGFEAQIAEAQRDAAASREEAEAERLARVELQKQLQPRRLSGKQIEDLAAKLKPFAAQRQVPITIIGAALDTESTDFAKDFETAFKAGGWIPHVTGWNQMGRYGLDLGMLEDPSNPKHIPLEFGTVVENIRHVIVDIGVPCGILPLTPTDAISLQKPEKNVLYLLVHRKPDVAIPVNKEKKQKSKAAISPTP